MALFAIDNLEGLTRNADFERGATRTPNSKSSLQKPDVAAYRKPRTMPRGPEGERRPAGAIGNAVHVMRIVVMDWSDIIKAMADDDAEALRARRGPTAPSASPRRLFAYSEFALRTYPCRKRKPGRRGGLVGIGIPAVANAFITSAG